MGILTAHLQKPLILSHFTPHGTTAAGFTNVTETGSNCTFKPAESGEFAVTGMSKEKQPGSGSDGDDVQREEGGEGEGGGARGGCRAAVLQGVIPPGMCRAISELLLCIRFISVLEIEVGIMLLLWQLETARLGLNQCEFLCATGQSEQEAVPLLLR
jgi:hypothetical protein